MLSGFTGAQAEAAPSFANTVQTLDAGGGTQAARSYENDGSVGGFGGLGDASTSRARHGYPGQLYQAVSLEVQAAPSSIPEETSTALGGTAVMDDDTLVALGGPEIRWTGYDAAIQSVSTAGLATAGAVLADTSAAFSAWYAGLNADGVLTVLDTDPDNYGLYAADLIPDAWQYLYFGLENPDAAPNRDPDGDGQNNRFECIAGVVPTNIESRFRFRIEPVRGATGQIDLVFYPRWSDRTYTPLFRTNLLMGSWRVLAGALTTDTGTVRRVTDLEAHPDTGFYRVRIERE